MGVNWKHYIVRGVRLKGKDWWDWIAKDEEVRADMEDSYRHSNVGGMVILSDPYSSEYAIIGVKLFESSDGRYEDAAIPFTVIPDDFSSMDSRLIQFLNINDINIPDTTLTPKTMIFTHYT